MKFREINAHSLNEFQIKLSHEAWENIFSNNDKDTNTTFNNFLDTFLKTFSASFPQKKTQLKQDNKNWLTTGIKTSYNNKRKLYQLCKESNDSNLKKHYKKYCKLLTKVITLAKKLYYSAKLTNSTNKPKTTWNIIKRITNNQKKSNNMLMMEIEGKLKHTTKPLQKNLIPITFPLLTTLQTTIKQRTLLMIHKKRTHWTTCTLHFNSPLQVLNWKIQLLEK